jgi:cation diffusion facilitator family transporter
VIKEGLYQYNARVGRRTGSTAIIANAWDHRSDAMCALAVLVGLAAVRLGGEAFVWADEVASLVVVAAITVSATALFRSAASELMDVQAGEEYVAQIRQCASAISDVMQVETLWVRKSGLEYFVDVHIQVRAELTVAEGHTIGHRVKDRLIEQFPAIRDVLVHLEPFPHTHPAKPYV